MKRGINFVIATLILLSLVACKHKRTPVYPSNSDYRLIRSEQKITKDGKTTHYVYTYSYNAAISTDEADFIETVVEKNAETNETTTYTYDYLSTNPIKYTIRSTTSEATYEYNATNGKLEKSEEITTEGTKQTTVTAEYEYDNFFVVKKHESTEVVEDATKTVTNTITQYENIFNTDGQLIERIQTSEIETISYTKTAAEDATWNETDPATNTEISKDVYAYYQDSVVQQTYLKDANTGVFEQKPYHVTTTAYLPEISLILRRVQTTYHKQDGEGYKKGDIDSITSTAYFYERRGRKNL